jgi:thymidylate synthase
MKNYLDLMQKIMDQGVDREGRNGKTRGLFTQQLRFDMKAGFPAMTTKKLAFRSVAAELFWFMSGYSDNNELTRLGCNIWTANAEADYWKPKAKFPGDLGRIYGVQWRDWMSADGKHTDQLQGVIDRLKKDPNDRRLIVSAWNPGELDQMALPPCHMMFQFFAANGKLSLHMFQRSCDMFLGVPFNIASYSLLLHMVAQVTGLQADECILMLADAHIYLNHFEQVKQQLERTPTELPKLWINPEIKNIDDFKMEDIKLVDYKYQSSIKAPMAV